MGALLATVTVRVMGGRVAIRGLLFEREDGGESHVRVKMSITCPSDAQLTQVQKELPNLAAHR